LSRVVDPQTVGARLASSYTTRVDSTPKLA